MTNLGPTTGTGRPLLAPIWTISQIPGSEGLGALLCERASRRRILGGGTDGRGLGRSAAADRGHLGAGGQGQEDVDGERSRVGGLGPWGGERPVFVSVQLDPGGHAGEVEDGRQRIREAADLELAAVSGLCSPVDLVNGQGHPAPDLLDPLEIQDQPVIAGLDQLDQVPR